MYNKNKVNTSMLQLPDMYDGYSVMKYASKEELREILQLLFSFRIYPKTG